MESFGINTGYLLLQISCLTILAAIIIAGTVLFIKKRRKK